MKRTEALSEIKICGYHGDKEKMTLIAAKKKIGKAAARKYYQDGQKMKERGEPCDCPKCKGGKVEKV
jgi:hypothetical protein